MFRDVQMFIGSSYVQIYSDIFRYIQIYSDIFKLCLECQVMFNKRLLRI